MLEYDRIDISEGIHINKTNASKEYNICHYYFFKDQKNTIFVVIIFLNILVLSVNHIFARVVMN